MSENKRRFRKNGSSFFESRTREQGPIHFKYNPETRYVPILKLLSMAAGGSENYFLSHHDRSIKRSVKYEIEYAFDNVLQNIIRFRPSMRRARSPLISIDESKTLSIFFFSVLGVTGSYHNALKEFKGHNSYSYANPKMIMKNPVDVFALSVVKMEDSNSIEFPRGWIEYDFSKIKLLISQEKLKSPTYMNNNYNKTVRNHLVRVIKDSGIETEVISDEEMSTYYENPFTFNSSSIMDIIQVDKEIKESVVSGMAEKFVRV